MSARPLTEEEIAELRETAHVIRWDMGTDAGPVLAFALGEAAEAIERVVAVGWVEADDEETED